MGITARIRQHRPLLAIIGLVGITAGVWLSQQPAGAQTDVHVISGGPGKHAF